MTLEQQRLEQARQLLRLRLLREELARRERLQAERERLAAAQAVREREAEVAGHRDARANLLQRAVQQAHELPRLAPYFGARRDELDDRLERAEYALIDDEEALEAATTQLAEASDRWRAARTREEAAQHLLARARREDRQANERRAEREDAPLSQPTPHGPRKGASTTW